MKINVRLLIVISTIIFITSCNKNIEDTSQYKSEINYPSLKVDPHNVLCDDGVLIFPSWSVFYEIRSIISEYTFEEKEDWENSLNFKSQEYIFTDIALKEYKLTITPYEDVTESYFIEHPEPDHCEEYIEAQELEIIEELYDDGKYINYTVKDLGMVSCINERGFVIIDSVLYQFIGDKKKQMVNGTVEDCDLLNSTNESNPSLGIYVRDNPELEEPEGKFFKSASTISNWVYSGNSARASCATYVKVEGFGWFNTVEYTSQLKCGLLGITLNSQRKNGWGTWIQYHGDYNISGATQVEVLEGYPSGPTNPNYEGQFLLSFQSIHGSTNSFPVTRYVNMPHFTGTIWPSTISKVFWCYSNINPIHFEVRTDIAGGASGIAITSNF